MPSGFPAVPLNSARLRIQMNAGHSRADIDHLLDILKRHQHLAEPSGRVLAANVHAGRRATARAPVTGPLAAIE